MDSDAPQAQVNRKRARVSVDFKQKVLEKPSKECLDNATFNCDDSFYGDKKVDSLKKELADRERYFLRKIQVYSSDFEDEKTDLKTQIMTLENDLEESRTLQLEVLMKMKNFKNRITELETKNLFYKNKIRKYESERMPDET